MTIRVHNRLVIGADQNLTFSNESAVLLASGGKDDAPQLTNFGSITVRNTTDSAQLVGVDTDPAAASAMVLNKADASFSIVGTAAHEFLTGIDFHQAASFNNEGTFSLSSAVGGATGVAADGSSLDFHNDGSFDIAAKDSSTAVIATGAADIVNRGEISVVVEGNFHGATGLDLHGPSTVTNWGEISVQGGGGADAIHVRAPDSIIDNHGKIVAREADPESNAGGIVIDGAGAVTINNWGAIKAYDPSGPSASIVEGYNAPAAAQVTINNWGTLYGGVYLVTGPHNPSGPDRVFNAGTIIGNVQFGTESDLFLTTGRGSVDGQVNGFLGDDSLTGGRASDTLHGDDGDDLLNGGGGDDNLFGGSGADTLTGGKGGDTLTGVNGADTFRYQSLKDSAPGAHEDLITDLFGGDRIDLSMIDADKHASGDQAFTLVDHLDGHAGEAALVYDAASDVTLLQLDVTGDGTPDAEMRLAGDHRGFDGLVL